MGRGANAFWTYYWWLSLQDIRVDISELIGHSHASAVVPCGRSRSFSATLYHPLAFLEAVPSALMLSRGSSFPKCYSKCPKCTIPCSASCSSFNSRNILVCSSRRYCVPVYQKHSDLHCFIHVFPLSHHVAAEVMTDSLLLPPIFTDPWPPSWKNANAIHLNGFNLKHRYIYN